MVNFGAVETMPVSFAHRTLYRHNATVTLMRTTADECASIARRIADRLNEATGPTVLVLPLHGISAIDAEGQPFHDPDADRVLFDTLRLEVKPDVRIVEVPAHINDAGFADVLATEMLALLTVPRPPAAPTGDA
jgi:uncharacterized protein (UPF0261 family)